MRFKTRRNDKEQGRSIYKKTFPPYSYDDL